VTEEELNFIETKTKDHEEDGLVFSHNDLLANNILVDSIKHSIVFIDYEYSSYNYPIFDIANYICESEFNYDVSEPPYFKVTPVRSEDFHRQVRFIEAYDVSKDLSLN
jgi:choline/ethanolamine kinase